MSFEKAKKRRPYPFRSKYIAFLIFLIIAIVTIFQDKCNTRISRMPLKDQENSWVEKDGFRVTLRDFGYATVTKVHDGDTVSIIIGNAEEKVRLIGVDAPELGQEPWGKRARRKLQEMMRKTDRTVKVEFDVEERDKYGRLLAYLWTKDGRLINEEMIKSGYAIVYTVPPNVRYVDRLRQAQNMALKRRVGIWGEKGLEERPSDYRKTHPRD